MSRAIHVNTATQVEIPLEQIARIDLSIPTLERLQSLDRLAALPTVALEKALGDLGVDLAHRAEPTRAEVLSRLSRHLRTLHQDAVWRIDDVLAAKPDYVDHLRPQLGNQQPAVFAFGLRDTYQNRFKPAWCGERGVLARPAEPLASRPHYVIYSAGDDPAHVDLGMADASSQGLVVRGVLAPARFAVAGTPLVWEGQVVSEIRRMGYQSDLRHEWHLPPSRWKADHARLQAAVLSAADPDEAGQAVMNEASTMALRPENDYYLESVGIDRQRRQLLLIAAHGSPASMAARQIQAGADAAVLTQEGGSCAYALWECEKDFSRADKVMRDDLGMPVWENAPRYFGMTTYFRPFALALGVLQLRGMLTEPPFREDQARSQL